MKKKNILPVAIAALALSIYALTARSYYVSPTGSDSNPGTISAPFRTIPKAISAAATGDVIYIRDGVYPAFNITKAVNIAGYEEEFPTITGQVRCYKLDGVGISGLEITGGSGSYTGAILLDQCNNATVFNNYIHDNLGGTISGIAVRGNNNRILGNHICNNAYVGIRLSAGTGIEVAYNEVCNHVKATGDADGIDIVSPAVTGAYIHHNEIYGNADDGIDTWTSPANIIEYNVSHHNGGTGDGNGFKLGGGSTGGGNTVTGNLAYDNETSGFTSNGNGNIYKSNTSHSNGEYGFIDSWRNAGGKSSFTDNIAYNNGRGNFGIDMQFILVFTGNSERAPTAITIPPTIQITGTPTRTPTILPTTTPQCYYPIGGKICYWVTP